MSKIVHVYLLLLCIVCNVSSEMHFLNDMILVVRITDAQEFSWPRAMYSSSPPTRPGFFIPSKTLFKDLPKG